MSSRKRITVPEARAAALLQEHPELIQHVERIRLKAGIPNASIKLMVIQKLLEGSTASELILTLGGIVWPSIKPVA